MYNGDVYLHIHIYILVSNKISITDMLTEYTSYA